MEKIVTGFLVAHIAAGTVALFSGPIAMLTAKGGTQHRRSGKIYFYSMVVVFVTAVILSLFKDIPFLLMIAFFSFYLVVSGYRALYLKKLHKGQKATRGDWAFSVGSLICSLFLLGWGVYKLFVQHDNFGTVAVVLGSLGSYLIYKRMNNFIHPPTDKNHWLYAHVTGMGGGYVATITAFLVVNIHFLPGPLTWILPSVVGALLITRWKRNYQKVLLEKTH